MRCVITGGGTGGHLAIARALEEALIERGHEALFIGSTSGQDRAWFDGPGGFSHAYFLETTGVVNQKGLRKALALWKVFAAMLKARRLIKRHRADAVISVGGFSAAPAAFAALTLFKPLFIHEQNAVKGRLNRLLKPFAKAFFSSYVADSPVKDYPVHPEFFKKARERGRVKRVIFLGGSQGARFINDLALSVAPELARRGIAVIHQCGEKDFLRVEQAYAELGIEAELYGFTRELPALLERSDLAVSRAGASTLWELCANRLPALFIPYPYAAGDHQYHNARFITDRDSGWCVRQEEAVEELLLRIVDAPMEAKSRQLRETIGPGGAEAIIKAIERSFS